MRQFVVYVCAAAVIPSLILAAPAAAPAAGYNPFMLPGFENPATSLMNGLASLIINNPRNQVGNQVLSVCQRNDSWRSKVE